MTSLPKHDHLLREIEVVDSHTEGEPTRLIVGGYPEPEGATLSEKVHWLHDHADAWRTGVVLEPRGHPAIVAGLLLKPENPGSDHAVIFMNDVGYLGMCGHGTMGLVATLLKLEMLHQTHVRIDTPAGTVDATVLEDGAVEISNVPSYLYRSDVVLNVAEFGEVVGDIAYGGNWFFLVEVPRFSGADYDISKMMQFTNAIRRHLILHGITGADGAEIDHIELYGTPTSTKASSRNFVLCPGTAYDRSPCGTGTSAKMAALATKGLLSPGHIYVQEGFSGGCFAGRVLPLEDKWLPTIAGTAHVTAHSILRFEATDPLRFGLRT